MNIVVFGSGAIGSLFGALLAKQHKVALVGRAPHITCIQQKGLLINGKTRLIVSVPAVESIKDVSFSPDLILLTVKSYDTETASRQLSSLINNQTVVVSLQNGLNNIQKIEQYIEKKHILAGVTTHGALFEKPGTITHTGKGKTILGELDGNPSERLRTLVTVFNQAGIETQIVLISKGKSGKKQSLTQVSIRSPHFSDATMDIYLTIHCWKRPLSLSAQNQA